MSVMLSMAHVKRCAWSHADNVLDVSRDEHGAQLIVTAASDVRPRWAERRAGAVFEVGSAGLGNGDEDEKVACEMVSLGSNIALKLTRRSSQHRKQPARNCCA